MIRIIIKIYMLVIIIDAILSFFPGIKHHEWVKYIRRASEFTEGPVRKFLPKDVPMDPSPLIVIILLQLLLTLW